MSKYRKKPVIIDAIQWTGKNTSAIRQFCPVAVRIYYDGRKIAYLLIPTLEGDHQANKNDWIIKGIKGEFYPCKPDIFEATYELVE